MTRNSARSRRRWSTALALVGLAAVANLGMTCGPASPAPDLCDTPGPVADGGVTSIEIGGMVDGQFVPFVDDAVAPLVFGGQGSPMVVARLRVHGAGLPACLPQATQLEQLDGEVIASESGAMATEPAGADARLTGEILLVYFGESATQVRLRATVGDLSHEVVVWTDAVGVRDAGVDAPPDASPDAP